MRNFQLFRTANNVYSIKSNNVNSSHLFWLQTLPVLCKIIFTLLPVLCAAEPLPFFAFPFSFLIFVLNNLWFAPSRSVLSGKYIIAEFLYSTNIAFKLKLC